MKNHRGTCFQKGIKLLSDERKFVRLIHRVSAGSSGDRGFTDLGFDRQSTRSAILQRMPDSGALKTSIPLTKRPFVSPLAHLLGTRWASARSRAEWLAGQQQTWLFQR